MAELMKILQNAGFDEKEAKVYLCLLKNNGQTAYQLSQKTGIERTLVYRTLDKMIQKGRVSYIDENKVRRFIAVSPKKILVELKQRQDTFKQALPELMFPQEPHEGLRVEIYRGLKGIKSMINEIRVMKKDYSVILAGKEIKGLSAYFSQLMKVLEEENIRERVLLTEGMSTQKSRNSTLRYLPKNFVYFATVGVCGDKVGIITSAEPFYAVEIESKAIAETFNSYFELLWRFIAKMRN